MWGTQGQRVDTVALLDTGASVSLIKACLWQKLGGELLPALPPNLFGLAGEELCVLGMVLVHFDTFGCDHACVVVQELNYEVILGMDLLKRGNAEIDLKAVQLTIFDDCLDITLVNCLPSQVNVSYTKEFPTLFSTPENPVGYCDVEKVDIITDGRVVQQRPYRMPLAKRKLVEEELNRLLAWGVIRPSCSNYSSPVTLAQKKDGSVRFCTAYMALNETIKDDKFVLPLITDILDGMRGSVVFSMVDIRSAFWCIPLTERSKPITAFSTHMGSFEYNRLPMGLKISSACFQRIVTKILNEYIGKFVFVYIDDLVIFSNSLEKHGEHVRTILLALNKAGLKVKESKCQFHVPEVHILGFVVNKDGVKPNPDRCVAISRLPVPASLKEVRSFLGMVNYFRRHIKDMAEIANPLVRLTKTGVNFVMGPSEVNAFERLKQELMSCRIMQFPSPNRPYYIYCDSSMLVVGAVLTQRDDAGEERVIYYLSKSLNKCQARYSTIEREALAVYTALTHFRAYVFGETLTIFTDHHPLVTLLKRPINNARILRWQLLISEFNAEVRYLPGKSNCKADFLSRVKYRASCGGAHINESKGGGSCAEPNIGGGEAPGVNVADDPEWSEGGAAMCEAGINNGCPVNIEDADIACLGGNYDDVATDFRQGSLRGGPPDAGPEQPCKVVDIVKPAGINSVTMTQVEKATIDRKLELDGIRK